MLIKREIKQAHTKVVAEEDREEKLWTVFD
jgi:hypothetical protein